jgi:glucose/arabinose dehydrogenase
MAVIAIVVAMAVAGGSGGDSVRIAAVAPTETPAPDVKFENPVGVAVAYDGSVYVVDSGNSRIQKFSPGP